MPLSVTEVHPTPNPNALKYSLSGPISDKPVSFFKPADGEGHPVASKLFAIKGVESVLLLHDFVTVNKSATAKWTQITPAVKKVLSAVEPHGAEA